MRLCHSSRSWASPAVVRAFINVAWAISCCRTGVHAVIKNSWAASIPFEWSSSRGCVLCRWYCWVSSVGWARGVVTGVVHALHWLKQLLQCYLHILRHILFTDLIFIVPFVITNNIHSLKYNSWSSCNCSHICVCMWQVTCTNWHTPIVQRTNCSIVNSQYSNFIQFSIVITDNMLGITKCHELLHAYQVHVCNILTLINSRRAFSWCSITLRLSGVTLTSTCSVDEVETKNTNT